MSGRPASVMVTALLALAPVFIGCDSSSAPIPAPTTPPTTASPPSNRQVSISPSAETVPTGKAASCSTGFADWKSWDQKPHHATRESTRFGRWRATVRGRTIDIGDPFLIHRPDLVVRYDGHVVGRSPIFAVPGTGFAGGVELDTLNAFASRLGSLCIARFDHRVVAAVVGMSTGNNCCMAVEMFRLTPTAVAPGVAHRLGNHGAAIETRRGRAAIVSTDWFGCGLTACAGGPAVTVIERYDGTGFRDVSRSFTGMLRREARHFRRASLDPKRTWLGGLAAWIADECRLGHEARAWREINALLRAGRLNGPRDWPRNAGFVHFAHRLLREMGFCRS